MTNKASSGHLHHVSDSDKKPVTLLKWSDIDKRKFFIYGTTSYSGLTLALHPISVLKTRQQVLNTLSNNDKLLHQQTLRETFREVWEFSGVRGLYRGAGIVVSLAVPARLVYITVLEWSRHESGNAMSRMVKQQNVDLHKVTSTEAFVAVLSGGISGGLAALSAQIIAVPMDVISMRQMVMSEQQFQEQGSIRSVVQNIVKTDGWSGLYRGFGLSMFTSLLTGTVWWAAYGGLQNWLDCQLPYTTAANDNDLLMYARTFVKQVASGLGAAFVATITTMPLDVVRTRLQVGANPSISGNDRSPLVIAKDILATSGYRGFFRGFGPRLIYMSLWGTVLSSFYEGLRHISRKT